MLFCTRVELCLHSFLFTSGVGNIYLYLYTYLSVPLFCFDIYVNKLSCTTDEGLTTENFGSYHYTILHQNRTLSSFLSCFVPLVPRFPFMSYFYIYTYIYIDFSNFASSNFLFIYVYVDSLVFSTYMYICLIFIYFNLFCYYVYWLCPVVFVYSVDFPQNEDKL